MRHAHHTHTRTKHRPTRHQHIHHDLTLLCSILPLLSLPAHKSTNRTLRTIMHSLIHSFIHARTSLSRHSFTHARTHARIQAHSDTHRQGHDSDGYHSFALKTQRSAPTCTFWTKPIETDSVRTNHDDHTIQTHNNKQTKKRTNQPPQVAFLTNIVIRESPLPLQLYSGSFLYLSSCQRYTGSFRYTDSSIPSLTENAVDDGSVVCTKVVAHASLYSNTDSFTVVSTIP